MLRISSSGKKKVQREALHSVTTDLHLPDAQFYLVDPNVVIGHGALAVHLEGDVQFPDRRGFRVVIAVHDPSRTIDRDCDEVRLAAARTLELPTKAMPNIRSLRVGAGDSGVLPVQRRVPYPPRPGAVEIALRSKDEFLSVERLVHIELQRLNSGGIVQVKIHVVDEMRDGVHGAQLPPPQRRAVRIGAADKELGGRAVEGRGGLELCHPVRSGRALPSGTGAGVA